MYVQGHPMYAHHLAHYGHPADTGFIEIENRWKAEHWQPEALIDLYKRAGAKYFMALGCHHDNLDAFDRSEEHTSELQSLMRISYAVFCLKKKNKKINKERDPKSTTNSTKK